MARIVALSSYVAYGHVGLGAVVPPLQALGHEVAALPTVVLSNHTGHRHTSGFPVDPAQLLGMIDALDANGWLGDVGTIVTGYLPTPAHVDLVVALITRVRARCPAVQVICDPILGDAPKGLYLPPKTAERIKHHLVPLADVLTPNAFELSWLTGLPAGNVAEAVRAAASLACRTVVVTSVPVAPDRLATLLVDSGEAVATTVAARVGVPHGTGDLLTGLLAAYLALGAPPKVALAQSGAVLEAAVAASLGRDDLKVTDMLRRLDAFPPLPLEPVA